MKSDSIFLLTRQQLRPLAERLSQTGTDFSCEESRGVRIGRPVQLLAHLLLKSLVPPGDSKPPHRLAKLNALDRIIAFVFAARQRIQTGGPDEWTDAGLTWLAARTGHLLVPRDWSPAKGDVHSWERMERPLRHLLEKVPRFFRDHTVKELEAAHLGIMWNALSARALALHQPVSKSTAELTLREDRMPAVPAWAVLTLTRNAELADPEASGVKQLPKLEELMNDLVREWWPLSGGDGSEWKIAKTVEKWDAPPPRGSCDPFSELLALCLQAGDLTPLGFAAGQCGSLLRPVESPRAAHRVSCVELCTALHEFGAALGAAALESSVAASARCVSAWHRADALMSRALSAR